MVLVCGASETPTSVDNWESSPQAKLVSCTVLLMRSTSSSFEEFSFYFTVSRLHASWNSRITHYSSRCEVENASTQTDNIPDGDTDKGVVFRSQRTAYRVE